MMLIFIAVGLEYAWKKARGKQNKTKQMHTWPLSAYQDWLKYSKKTKIMVCHGQGSNIKLRNMIKQEFHFKHHVTVYLHLNSEVLWMSYEMLKCLELFCQQKTL